MSRPYIALAALVLALLVGVAAYWAGTNAGSSRVQQAWDKERAALAQASQQEERVQRTEEARRETAKEEIRDDAQQKSAQASKAEASAGAARIGVVAAAGSVRDRAVGSGASAAGTDTAAGAGGPSQQDRSAFDLFIGVLDRHSRELVEVSGYADRLRIAGEACEASYDSLTAVSSGP